MMAAITLTEAKGQNLCNLLQSKTGEQLVDDAGQHDGNDLSFTMDKNMIRRSTSYRLSNIQFS